jgi:hypothetical protein
MPLPTEPLPPFSSTAVTEPLPDAALPDGPLDPPAGPPARP